MSKRETKQQYLTRMRYAPGSRVGPLMYKLKYASGDAERRRIWNNESFWIVPLDRNEAAKLNDAERRIFGISHQEQAERLMGVPT